MEMICYYRTLVSGYRGGLNDSIGVHTYINITTQIIFLFIWVVGCNQSQAFHQYC